MDVVATWEQYGAGRHNNGGHFLCSLVAGG